MNEKWVQVIVDTDGETALARDFLGGVLVYSEAIGNRAIYLPSYRIKMATGDMDHNVLERFERPSPEYSVVLRPAGG